MDGGVGGKPVVARSSRKAPGAVVAPFLASPVVLLVIDLLTPPSVRIGPLMVAAPALAAAFCGPLAVAAVAFAALACGLGAAAANNQLGGANFPVQFAAVVLMSLGAVGAARVRQRRERELAQARWVAEMAQRVLLRPLPRRLGGLELSSLYLASEEEATVGGDLYAAVDLGATARVMVGDVQGKGLGAVEVVSYLLGAFRRAARDRTALPHLTSELERSLREDLKEAVEADAREAVAGHHPGRALQESFVTVVVVEAGQNDGGISVVNRGHPAPLRIHEGKVLPLEPVMPALPLGLGDLDGDLGQVDTFDFAPGDTLLLYTDGVAEARDAAGEFYPLEERLAAWTDLRPDGLLRTLRADLLAHVRARLGDDIAMVAIRRVP